MTADDAAVRRSARAVLALGIATGLVLAAVTVLTNPTQVGIASTVYFHAAEAALAGEDVYAVSPPETPGYHYLYPPVVVLLFVPHALLGGTTAALALQTLANVVAALGTAAVILRALERRTTLERVDYALVTGFCVLSAHALAQIVQGQVTLWLAFALAVGFDALERDRESLAGVAFGLAALVKLFPALVGLWLLRRRTWRAIVAATATGVGGLLLGLLVFGPEPTVQYLTEVLPNRFADQTFDGRPDPTTGHTTLRRQLAALFPGGGPAVSLLAVVILVPPLAACYRRVDTDERCLAAILATLVAILLFFPFQPLYFALLSFPLVCLLYVLPTGRARTLLLAGTLLTYAMVGYVTAELAVEVLGLPAGLESALLTAAAGLFTFVLPPTVGMWLLLAACVVVCTGDAVSAADRSPESTGDRSSSTGAD